MKIIKLLTLALLIGLTALYGTEYTVDKENSMVTFKIRHALIAKVEGKFNEFSGTYEYDANSSTFSSFVGEATMDSVDTDDKYRDDHLKLKVFDIEKYPKMDLKLVKQDGNTFVADLTIKEVTKRVGFSISLVADSKNKFILSGKISRKDFNLKFSDTAEVGGLAVGDKVEINILFAGV
ncbi:YceI family protein [bacterium]|nr:YceI family protein [bacterium]MBU1957676.1 YceI family protein [bacterium]